MGTELWWLVLSIYILPAVETHKFILRPIYGNKNEGYVEAQINGTWGIMTSSWDSFDDATAEKLCNYFGFGSTGFSTISYVALPLTNNVLSWDKLMSCSAHHTDVNECVYGEWTNNGHWVTTLEKGWTRLHCYAFDVTDVRLMGGLLPHEGRFEVKVGGRWGVTCEYPNGPVNVDDVYITNSFGSFMCSMLGYTDTWSAWINYPVEFSNISVPITDVWMTSLDCNSGVTNINQCSFRKGTDYPYCGGKSLKCQPVQLLNGTTPSSGIIAAGLFRQQHVICGTSAFNAGAANVTCSLLGHHGSNRMTRVNWTYINNINVFNGSILCEGSEKSLEMCDIIQQGECQDSTVLKIECFDEMDIISVENKSHEGVFTFKYYNRWWLLKGEAFSETTAMTLCNMLGHGFNGSSKHIAELPKHVVIPSNSTLDTLECSGNKINIAQCSIRKYINLSCWRCPPQPGPSGYAVLYCDACQPGYYGKFCTECNCNNRTITPCDIETGECTCMAGWSGISCEIDQDECNVPMLCPNNSVCINTPGSYQCECKPGYTKSGRDCNTIPQEGDLIELLDCSPGVLATICTECNCNNRSKNSCDIETGECSCIEGWTGTNCQHDINECTIPEMCPENSVCANEQGSYQCECRTEYIETDGVCKLIDQREPDSNVLIIALSSAVGGLLLISVIATCCMCMYKRRATLAKTENKTANKTKDAGSNVKSEDYSSIDVPTLPARQVTNTEPRTDHYATIDDTQKPTSSRSINEDARPDVPRRDPVNKSGKKNDVSNQTADIKDYDYPHPVIPTYDGYIKLTGNPKNNPNGGYMNSAESGSVALPTDEDGYLRVGNTDNMPTQYRINNYQKLNPKSRQEHDYGRIKY